MTQGGTGASDFTETAITRRLIPRYPVADVLGSPDAIISALRAVGGVERLSDLDTAHYARFRTRLIRLANPMTGGKRGAAGKFEKRAQG